MQPVANFTLNCCFLRTVSAEVGVKEKRTILAICPMKTCSKRRDALSRLRIPTNSVSLVHLSRPRRTLIKIRTTKSWRKGESFKNFLPSSCIEKPVYRKVPVDVQKYSSFKHMSALKAFRLLSWKDSRE